MPSLLELFSNKKYETLNNQTPKDAFEIRDSKSVPISSTSFALNKTATTGIIKLRNGNNTERIGETRLEQENVGLFQYMVLGSPAIYGTDVLRMSTQQTSLVETMKIGTGGKGLAATAAQIVGDTVGEAFKFGASKAVGVPATFNPKALATKAVGQFKNTFGSFFPDVLIPSKVVSSPLFKLKVPGLSEEFRTHQILATLKNISNGTKVATFLAKNATGTPDQIKQTLVNQGLNIAQEQAKKLVAKKVSGWLSRGGEKAQQLAKEIRQDGNVGIRYSSLKKYSDLVKNERDFGKNPLNFANQPFQTNDTDYQQRNDLSTNLLANYVGDAETAKQTKLKFLPELGQNLSEYQTDENTIYSKVLRNTDRTKLGLISEKNLYKDELAKIGPFNVSDKTSEVEKQLDSLDYIPLKFVSLANSTAVVFRGTITGLSEQFSPTWDSSRFIGSPFNFYTYQSIERSVQFTFKVASLNKEEHKKNWQKLGYLSSLVYPQNYEAVTGAVSAPFLKLTLGDMYRNKECFIDSMTYNIDDDYTWEVGLNGQDVQNYRLPMVIEITMTLKFVEAKSNTFNYVPGSETQNNKALIGEYMYGYRATKEDARLQDDRQNANDFKSTNKGESAPLIEEKNGGAKIEFDDESPESKEVQKRLRLTKSNTQSRIEGTTTYRYIYIQKRTNKQFFGDGSPVNPPAPI